MKWYNEPEKCLIAVLTTLILAGFIFLMTYRTSPQNFKDALVVSKSEYMHYMLLRTYKDGKYHYKTIRTTRYEFDLYNVGDKIIDDFWRK